MDNLYAKSVLRSKGSALIMAVVLTSLLAILGTMFLMSQRMSGMQASAISESKELDEVVNTVTTYISSVLTLDVPRGDPNVEYYDYPGLKDSWLSSLEPEITEDKAGYLDDIYIWRQITDLTGYLNTEGKNRWGYNEANGEYANRWVSVQGSTKYVTDYPELTVDSFGRLNEIWADADGDGVADSKWVDMGIVTPSGQNAYAAIRIIDNGGMLNVNTANVFDANSRKEADINGRYQTHIDLGGVLYDSNDTVLNILEGNPIIPGKLGYDFASSLLSDRSELRSSLIQKVVRNFSDSYDEFMPFDISDELELRYRFCVNSPYFSRLENLWNSLCYYWPDRSATYTVGYPHGVEPYWGKTGWLLGDWQKRVTEYDWDDQADKRHIVTTMNVDRVIDPNGDRMYNINSPDVNAQDLYDIKLSRFANPAAANAESLDGAYAQIAANLVDFSDDNQEISIVKDRYDNYHYGFERPFVYLSELTYKFVKEEINVTGPIGAPKPYKMFRSYGFEVYEHSGRGNEGTDPLRIRIKTPGQDTIVPLKDSMRSGSYYVFLFNDPNADLSDDVRFSDMPENGATRIDPEISLSWTGFPDDMMPDVADADKWTYEFYFGPNETDVSDSNSVERFGDTEMYELGHDEKGSDLMDFKTGTPAQLATGTTYYWRLDDIFDGDLYDEGPVFSFTTWETEPDIVWQVRDEFDPAVFEPNMVVTLERFVDGNYVEVDYVDTSALDPNWIVSDINVPKFFGVMNSFERDISRRQTIRCIWDFGLMELGGHSLGHNNNFNYTGDSFTIQTTEGDFCNIGELGWLFNRPVYGSAACKNRYDEAALGHPYREGQLRVDLTDPNFQCLFQWFTAMETGKADELRVAGRININTAPWYVMAQLPWVSNDLARSIGAYRDKLDISGDDGPDYKQDSQLHPRYYDPNSRQDGSGNAWKLRENLGFASIGELTAVTNAESSGERSFNIAACAMDGKDQIYFPDVRTNYRTRRDGAVDDLEERNMIFSRISDLVTVRSDLFTAYIVVRAGLDGPQKRVIGIFDRSECLKGEAGKVKIKALWTVPDGF
jgi:hypothetical protein